MTTMITVCSSDGCEGLCDTRCHDAVTPECDCVCGGLNHGVVFEQAVEKKRALFEQMAQSFADRKGPGSYITHVNEDAVFQLELPL